MKIKKELVLCIIFLMIPLVSPIELTLSKESYSPQETLQAEIVGNFATLKYENFFIYEEGIPRQTPVISDLIKHDNKYYFYAVLPNKEGEFTLQIKNAKYIDKGELITKDIIKNFTIKRAENAMAINPGFIATSSDFFIDIKSLDGNHFITAEIEESGEKRNVSLIEYIGETLEFSISGIKSKQTNLKVGDYSIPVFIIQKESETEEEPVKGKKRINFLPSELKGTVSYGEDYFFKVIIENAGEGNLTNLELSSDLNAKLNPEKIDFLEKEQRTTVDIVIPRAEKGIKKIEGEITIKSGDQIFSLPVLFNVTENEGEVDLGGTSITETLSCRNLGQVCVYPEVCSGETAESLEGACCLGECKEVEETSYTPLIGITLLVVLVFIIVFIYLKARKKPKSEKEILNEKMQKFEKRMKPPKDEVKGKLDKV